MNLRATPEKTLKSAAAKKLKWKLLAKRKPGQCTKAGCSKPSKSKLFCPKHRKLLRKMQLKLNNIPWVAKKRKLGAKYEPNQKHLVYKGKPTEWTRRYAPKAIALVKKGHNKWTVSALTKVLKTVPPKPKKKESKEPFPTHPKRKRKVVETWTQLPVKNVTPNAAKVPVMTAIQVN